MLTEILVSFFTLIFLYISYQYAVARPKGFPPGPPRIPLFGSYLFLMLINFKYLHKAVLQFSKWYKSDTVGFYMGVYPIVVVHNAKEVKEVLTNQVFDGRPKLPLATIRDPRNVPSGPPRIPLFGSYLFMMMVNFKCLHKAVLQFSKWYGSDIIGLYMGNFPVVVVHSAKDVKQVLNNEVFDGRPKIRFAEIRDPRMMVSGIFFEDGPLWKEQRRFVLRYLRDFGFGRRFDELELVIKEEITDMLDLIRHGPRYEHEKQLVQPDGYRILLPNALGPFVINSLFHIMLNERYPRAEQADLIRLVQFGMQFQRNGDDYGKMLSILPWVMRIFPNWSSYNVLMEANRFIYEFFAKFIDHHLETYDDSATRNFLDLYIKEIKKAESVGDLTTSYNREQFIMGLIDFSLPAFTAVSTQIALLIQYLMLYPDVLKRIQNEIDDVVGNGRLPTLEDRINLPFTEATVREGLRIETLVPSDVPHRTLADTTLGGYNIPKDTIIAISLYAYHMDKRIWGDPEMFRPERFLDETGKLSLKKDVTFPFGAGKRLCAGETFARNMLFLLTSALCQNFNFVLGPNDKLPDPTKNLSGLIISPKDFWVQLEERK